MCLGDDAAPRLQQMKGTSGDVNTEPQMLPVSSCQHWPFPFATWNSLGAGIPQVSKNRFMSIDALTHKKHSTRILCFPQQWASIYRLLQLLSTDIQVPDRAASSSANITENS